MLPLVCCVTSHLRKEFFFSALWIIGECVHADLHVVVFLRLIHWSGPKSGRQDGRLPINARCSILNDILPIRDWRVFFTWCPFIGSFWLRPGTSVRCGVLRSMEYRMLCSRKDRCRLHSRNPSFNGGGTLWLRNGISPGTSRMTKWRFIFKMLWKKKGERGLNGHTVSNLWRHCIRLCSTRKPSLVRTPRRFIQSLTFCNES